MPVDQDYEPRYVGDLSNVPISGPDDYTDEEKRKALFHAETELELDVNDGEQIATSSVKDIHKLAVMNLATHVLTHAAEEPSDVTLGDMADGGGTITEYSSRYGDAYDTLIDKIVSTGAGDSSSDNYAVFVNTGQVADNSTTHTVS